MTSALEIRRTTEMFSNDPMATVSPEDRLIDELLTRLNQLSVNEEQATEIDRKFAEQHLNNSGDGMLGGWAVGFSTAGLLTLGVAANVGSSVYPYGVLQESAADGENAWVQYIGRINILLNDTSVTGITGDPCYLSDTDGFGQSAKPTHPIQALVIGQFLGELNADGITAEIILGGNGKR